MFFLYHRLAVLISRGVNQVGLKLEPWCGRRTEAMVMHVAVVLEDNSSPDMKRRISLEASVMSSLSRIWRDKILQLSTKIRLYQALVMSVLLYAAETWTLSCDEKTLEAFHMKCQRQILHIHWSQHVKTQKYPPVPAYHLLWTSSEEVVCQYSAT